jgi:hypothetical protein
MIRWLALALLLGLARASAAETFEGPLPFGLYEGDRTLGRSATPRTELSLAADANALLDTPHFFGTLAGVVTVRGSYAVDDRTEVFGALEAAQYRFIQNTSLTQSRLSLGQLSVGAQRIVWRGDTWALTPLVRVVLPTSTAYVNARTFGADVMLLAQWQPFTKVSFHGQVGATGSVAATEAASNPRAGAVLLAGAEWKPARWFGAVLETGATMGQYAALDQFTVSAGLRFAWRAHYGLELGGVLPIAGSTRMSFAGGLRFAWQP